MAAAHASAGETELKHVSAAGVANRAVGRSVSLYIQTRLIAENRTIDQVRSAAEIHRDDEFRTGGSAGEGGA